MKKNSFGQGLAILFVVAGILYVIGSIGAAREPKCIEAGCDNKQASGSSYCYLHKPYTGSSSGTSTSSSSSSYSGRSKSRSRLKRWLFRLSPIFLTNYWWLRLRTRRS